MPDLVLVLHDNGIIAPVSRALAERRNLQIVEGDAVRPNGRPVRPVRANGRPVKPRRNLDPLAGPDDYQAMTVKQLKGEIAERNDRRDAESQLPVSGNKAELVALLERDDEAAAHTTPGQTGTHPDDSETSDADASDEAVTPTEGAADSTLTNTKE